MQKKIVYLFLIFSFIGVLVSGCIKETNEGRILYVDSEHYTSIQDAVDAASNNDTIIVSQGTYYETIIIEKSIKLIAAEPNKTIVSASEQNLGQPYIIQIKTKGCTIQGFSIQGNYPRTNASGITIFYSNNTITQNNISDTSYGIYIETDSENNSVSFNTVTNSQHGIYISASYNDVFDNWMSNNVYGIYVRHCSLNSIFLNHIFGNNWGIRLKGATYNQIYQNQIQNNVEGVYSCCGAMVNTLYKNNFVNNSENAYDDDTSNLFSNGIGNYWSDYLVKYPTAQSQDNVWDVPYSIPGGDNVDRYPVVVPFSI